MTWPDRTTAGANRTEAGSRPPGSDTAGLSEAKRRLLEIRQRGVAGPAPSRGVERARADAPARPATSIPRRSATGPAPASFAQERLWFFDQLEPGNPAYNIACAIGLKGPLQHAALEHALGDVVARHEALRTTFQVERGSPVQIMVPGSPVHIPAIDCSSADRPGPDVAARLTEDARRPFDLARGPIARATLYRSGPEDHVLLLAVHHIACDGMSLGVLFDELAEGYAAHVSGRQPRLPALPVQYSDYADWQRDRLSGPAVTRDLAYWRAKLMDVSPLDLPGDRPRPPRQTYRGARRSFHLAPELSASLRELSRREGVTLFMTLLAAFKAVLHRYTGQEDIAVGTPIVGRAHTELEGLIGFFVNTLVLRTDLSGHPTFRELLARVRDVALAAYDHDALPFEQLVAELQPARTLSHGPLFQVLFALDNTPVAAPSLAGLDTRLIDVDLGTARWDLALAVKDAPDGIAACVEYSADLFDASTIERMIGHIETLCAGIAARPDLAVSALPLLTDAERRLVLVEWNDTRRDYPAGRTIHELFDDWSARTPDAVALTFEGERLTYGALDERANRLGRHLQALGVGPGILVAISMERSIDLVVGLLGILKAGGAYVPLDPAYPSQRLAFVLDDTRAPVLLTLSPLQSRLPSYPGRVVCLDRDWPVIARQRGETPANRATPEDVAYVMYTSGSTGQPKGARILHRGVVRLVMNTDYAELTAREVLLQLSTLAFDASTFEIWGSLLHGARLAILPPGVPSVAELGRVLRRERVTTMLLTPSLFNVVVEEDAAGLTPVRQLLVGGDVLSALHARRVLRERPELRLINAYGPTEGTTIATCFRVTGADGIGTSVPIGRPIANTRVYVLDGRGEPVPVGVPGELYIGGDGVADGYLNRPDLTAERFQPDPFAERPGARLYRTGDRVRYRPDGNLEFLGRVDHQVKIRGFRVEPGEIEAALRQHPEVLDAAVVARQDQAGDKSLVAYYSARRAPGPSADELRECAREALPAHMIPSRFIPLPALPLTPSGKVDRHALPEPGSAGAVASERSRVAPRNGVEAKLVQIWEDVLGVRPIGVTQDFFELGGHSLLAVRMFGRLHHDLGVALPLAALFEGPTIAGLASRLHTDAARHRGRSLVAIQARGVRPPLFAVPGVGGNVLCYGALARIMGAEQPFYGLQSRGLDGSEDPLTRIEDIAAAFVAEIREIQPSGPYFLAGTCMGGVVAWEMAQQLGAAGAPVGLLALIETWPPPAAAPIRRHPGWPRLAFFARRLVLAVQTGIRLRGRRRLSYVRERIGALARGLARRDLLRDNRPEFYQGIVSRANLLALQQYRPRAYAGPVVLFCAEGRIVPEADDGRLAWRQLAAHGLEIHTAPGDDSGLMLVEPNVRVLAGLLEDCLNRARRKGPAGQAA